jgi:myo-inositol catabolism protein IolH
MVKIALDPTPFHATHGLLDFPEVAARLGYEHLRYITNPPGTPARVHQHLKIGDGDVDWAQLFGILRSAGFLGRQDALIVSNVFAEDETADETSRYQLSKIRELVDG